MWFIGKSILAYLIKDNIKPKEKEKLLKKRIGLIKLEVESLNEEDLVNYLVHNNTPEEVKILICEKIKKISESSYSTEKKQLENIINIYKKKKTYSKNELKLNYYPKELKKVIIDNIYKDTAINLITSNSIPLVIKKAVTEASLSREDAIKLLSSNLSKNLKDMIIEIRINEEYEISSCLNEKNIVEDLKKQIIITKVNKDNIFKVLSWAWSDSEKLILELKTKELEEIIEEQTKDTILNLINGYHVPDIVINELFERKINTIIEAIKIQPEDKIKESLRREKNNEIIDLLIKYRKKDIYTILKKLTEYEILNFLNLKRLPDEYKEYIIEIHSKAIEKKINEMRKSELDAYYINYESHLPKKIQKQIISQRKEDFIKDILEKSEDEIKKSIRYNYSIIEVTELIIDLRVNEKNILELLSDRYIKTEVLNLIITKKNALILSQLEQIGIFSIFKRSSINLSNYSKEIIIENNKDYFLNKINELDIDAKYKLLNEYDTADICKKLILESLNIKDIDLNVCLDLLKTGDSKLILENFSKIRDFISKSNISFESFIQYGSGSQKHKDWLNNIINIVENNEINDFINCKEYFFNNYYSEDKEKENTVYIISNYLELLDNYEKYKELYFNLTNTNKDLTKEDKLNISFLFNLNNITDIDLPKTLEELSAFKSKIYEKYINVIKDNSTSLEELKEIFNNLLLCNSNIILEYIGGTGALRTLKKDNENSNTIIRLVDELMNYSKMIEMVNDTNNIDGLRKILEYTFTDISTLTKMQNIFSEFERKITKLYELDSKNNLTTLERNETIEGVLNHDLSEKYGGKVFDYSDKNYALYAHVASHRENIEDLVNGIANGKSNFISVSPISYRGQKYYWNRHELILAYDKIPNGSFVCSSISNMGSNCNIVKNSSEVTPIDRIQRGILETSAATKNNSEALLYREGLIPCGLILPGGREPTVLELEYHEKYNLPFIITQEIEKPIENPEMILKRAEDKTVKSIPSNELEKIKELLNENVKIKKENDEYTGREIALITDCHSMYEPTLAALEDIRRNGIEEIYSLGDNTGVGPNPAEVFDLLEEYKVKSIAGNSEYYHTLGTEPFPYFSEEKKASQEWTKSKLGPERIRKIKLYPASIDLMLGDKKIALCHFANDVRWDFREHSTHTYQANFESGESSKQFLYTNSDECKTKINNTLTSHKKASPEMRGYQSSKKEPLFNGKKVTDYDAVIQGHVHFDMDDYIENTDIYTLRAVGMGYNYDPKDTACYYILKERKDNDGYDLEQRLVKFNRNNLLSSIYTTDMPNKQLILRFVEPKK